MDIKRLARDERLDFAAFLETLTPEQWDAPTLCEGWSVRDVVAHVISYDELTPRDLVRRFAKGRFTPGKVNSVGVTEYVRRGPDELVALLRKYAEPRGLTAGFGGGIALTDCLVHQQDIRRPLGLPRTIPGERLLPALRLALFAPVIRGFWQIRGVRLVATDLDWSAGSGPVVQGPAEACLMALAGRRGVAGELSGPGQAKLAARLG
ncbi:maleylpyruvate isomerase family mycothiol-dependent enzyme [Amycolatopsis sp. NPDC059021]|uniref:maleylpyruvate isomerase family mycothiol-dependent enzyme n=1 Tax=Amycolatopsis sp. NPDC059021 TaxID=3346704 RepID=UPI00366E17EE